MILRPKFLLPLTALLAALAAGPVYAHGFGQRYDLPVPLGYFMVGAGAAVTLSFVVASMFVKGDAGGRAVYWRYNLFSSPLLRLALMNPLTVFAIKAASVFLLGLVIAAGLFGSNISHLNWAPTFVWIVWWVGMGFIVALLGNVWAIANPWHNLYEGAQWIYSKFRPGSSLSLEREMPEGMGVWPAVALFLLFSWIENSYVYSSMPNHIGVMAIAYTVIALGGMHLYGKRQWLRHGEAFSVVFSLLAKFAPTEVRVNDPTVCDECTDECRGPDDECVNCYECFELLGQPLIDVAEGATQAVALDAVPVVTDRELNIRPFGVGLGRWAPSANDMLVMVVLLLATVTYDGFSATPAWSDVRLFSLERFIGIMDTEVLNGVVIADTLGLLLFPCAFFLVYLLFSGLASRMVGGRLGSLEIAREFMYTLIPIALAYNIAHFLTLLLIQGQAIIPIASDPFGKGWDLFGTADYVTDIGIVTGKSLWFLSVAVVVAGHVTSVYLAHKAAMRLFKDPKLTLRSQAPMAALMVLYTVVSLWIIAQPIVD